MGKIGPPAKALPLPPVRCLVREEAAAYVGFSPTGFDRLVSDGAMPKGLKFRGKRLWDVRKLDAALDQLFDDEANPWDH